MHTFACDEPMQNTKAKSECANQILAFARGGFPGEQCICKSVLKTGLT